LIETKHIGFSDGQTSFPPKSVQLKRAFSIQPWSDSDENVGNLLMVRCFTHLYSFYWLVNGIGSDIGFITA